MANRSWSGTIREPTPLAFVIGTSNKYLSHLPGTLVPDDGHFRSDSKAKTASTLNALTNEGFRASRFNSSTPKADTIVHGFINCK